MTTADPGRKLYIMVGVIFGLLCILQATLNISLHLSLYSSYRTTLGIVKRNLSDCDNKTLDIEASIATLTEERDELKKKLSDFNDYSQQGWVYFSGGFYYVSSITANWYNSSYDCRGRGADLLIVNTKEEQDFTNQYHRIFWIGLTDSEREGTWKWVDGSPMTISFWHSREPNSYRGKDEDCVNTMFYRDDNSWNDANCGDRNFWICEKKMFS